jgi:hypothetical protein
MKSKVASCTAAYFEATKRDRTVAGAGFEPGYEPDELSACSTPLLDLLQRDHSVFHELRIGTVPHTFGQFVATLRGRFSGVTRSRQVFGHLVPCACLCIWARVDSSDSRWPGSLRARAH